MNRMGRPAAQPPLPFTCHEPSVRRPGRLWQRRAGRLLGSDPRGAYARTRSGTASPAVAASRSPVLPQPVHRTWPIGPALDVHPWSLLLLWTREYDGRLSAARQRAGALHLTPALRGVA